MIKVLISDHLSVIPDSVAIAVLRVPSDGDGPRQILRLGDDHLAAKWEDLPDTPTSDFTPTLTLNDSVTRALLDALTRHYHGADDTRALRRDYDAERVRVDRALETISQLAVSLAASQPRTPGPRVTLGTGPGGRPL
ncbi:MAG TPA: hypothetical protein VFQ44_01895 [Streptosporangiaceae bacterium]|nr:hypothetical protein [Streptosporangiaceae bacterium]